MACDEDAIRKNPFIFKLTDVVVNDTVPRVALTEEHLGIWMNFIEKDNTYCKYYDEFVVLLETGMRVSEFCGLTGKDLDFKNRRIRVDHQLIRERGGKYYVEETKTSSGRRFLPMNETVYASLKKMLERRPTVKAEPYGRRLQRIHHAGQERKSESSITHRKRDALGNEEVQEASSGQPSAAHHPSCVPTHLLHELCKRRHGH